LAVNACAKPEVVHSVSALRPDKTNPERFVCELAGTRPPISPDYLMNWEFVGQAKTVQEAVTRAQAEHQKHVTQKNVRERTVATYVLLVEDRLFLCFNNMTWQREFYSDLDTVEQ
jgi:hypothetical protein